MSNDHEVTIPTHPNVYTNYTPRTMNVYFSEPADGINEETGFCLFISGYGASSNSKVYRKMRSVFADQDNLVTVQCDYFGNEFMGESRAVNLNVEMDYAAQFLTHDELMHVYEGNRFQADRFVSVATKYPMSVMMTEFMDESLDNFNDMGVMQALDNLTALLYVMNDLRMKGISFNGKKVIAYGHSHGGYLSHLCNAFAPNLISLLIDNSGWLFPNYLMVTRDIDRKLGSLNCNVKFDYLAKELPYDFNLLCLPMLYQAFRNNCQIVSFHGLKDGVVLARQKNAFCRTVANCTYVEIGEEQVDGVIFKSTTHGLDADFLNLFAYVVHGMEFVTDKQVSLPEVSFETEQKFYEITYRTGAPLFFSRAKE